jgi:hypothetical protein
VGNSGHKRAGFRIFRLTPLGFRFIGFRFWIFNSGATVITGGEGATGGSGGRYTYEAEEVGVAVLERRPIGAAIACGHPRSMLLSLDGPCRAAALLGASRPEAGHPSRFHHGASPHNKLERAGLGLAGLRSRAPRASMAAGPGTGRPSPSRPRPPAGHPATHIRTQHTRA